MNKTYIESGTRGNLTCWKNNLPADHPGILMNNGYEVYYVFDTRILPGYRIRISDNEKGQAVRTIVKIFSDGDVIFLDNLGQT